MPRFIGIRHRVKLTAEGEERPTQVAIVDEGKLSQYDLSDDTAELDWVLARHPIRFRPVQNGEDLSSFLPRQLKERRLKPEEDLNAFAPNRRRLEGKIWYIVTQVPEEFDGLRSSDTVGMVLGGSGDRLAFALSRRAEELGGGTQVLRIPPFILKEHRQGDKEEDATNLAQLVATSPDLFYPVTRRDRELILVRASLDERTDAMKARIGCEQRLRQRVIGSIFLSEEGRYPEGSLEDVFEGRKADDRIWRALSEEETACEHDMAAAVERLPVYQQLFQPIEGVGPRIATGLIAAIGNIGRFTTKAQLKAFCGVHVLSGGKYEDVPPEKSFPRRRHGAVGNWHPEARQALFLLADQFNRRPDSFWGRKLREYKVKFRAAHPEVVVENGKKRYTDAHIHKMATWRTVTKFVEWLHREWTKLR